MNRNEMGRFEGVLRTGVEESANGGLIVALWANKPLWRASASPKKFAKKFQRKLRAEKTLRTITAGRAMDYA